MRCRSFRLQSDLEVPQERGRRDDAVSADPFGILGDAGQHFGHVLQVGVGVDPARDRQPDQFERCRGEQAVLIVHGAQIQRSQFSAPDATVEVELTAQRVAGKLGRFEVR